MKDSAKITVIFPEKSDTNAEREFIQRLKAIYLERVVASALQCPPLVDTMVNTMVSTMEKADRKNEKEDT
jgi:hypothetical protein